MAGDMRKICRICLAKENEDTKESFTSVFCVDLDQKITLAYMIISCSVTKVQKSDGLPIRICQNCMVDLRRAYTFKVKCEESYHYLKDLLKHHHIEFNDDSPSDVAQVSLSSEKFTQTDAPSLHVCEQCDEKFFSKDELRAHRTSSHPKAESVCKFCSKKYSRLFHLQTHIAAAHPEHGPMANPNISCNKCPECDKVFTRSTHMKRHLLNIHKIGGKKEIKSENEETVIEDHLDSEEQDPELESVIKIENLLKEVGDESAAENDNQQHDTDEYSEDDNAALADLLGAKEDVKKQSPPKSRVKKKRVTEVDETKRHECEQCGKSFSRATHLKRHMVTHFGIKNYECDLCKKTFARPDHLKNHIHSHSEHKPFECVECSKTFARAEQLRRHKETRHTERPRVEAKTDICEICNKGFTTAKYLQIHMRIHSETRTFDCKFCDQKFGTKSELADHGRLHTNEKPFLCSECGLRFVRNDYLVIHMRRHNGEKPYKCKFCNKGFPRATDLNVHEKYHTGEKSHLCNLCGKGFQRAYNLVVHMRVHTGERPYQCSHCNKSFAQGNDLKAHVRRHTGERYKCEICGEGFIQGYHLTHHKRNRHGIDAKSHIRRVAKFTTFGEQQQQVLLQQQKSQIKQLHNLQEQSLTLENEYQLKDPKIEPLIQETQQQIAETERNLEIIMETVDESEVEQQIHGNSREVFETEMQDMPIVFYTPYQQSTGVPKMEPDPTYQ